MVTEGGHPREVRSRDRRLAEALALHEQIPVFVGYFNSAQEQFWPTGGRQCDLQKLDRAGVQNFVASVGSGAYFQTGVRQFQLAGPDDWLLQRQLQGIDRVTAWIAGCPRTHLVTKADHLCARTDEDKIGVILHVTGNNHTTSLDVVDEFSRRGVRATHPAMAYHNRWCVGFNGMRGPVLSDFGRAVIARMNELGILLDTAHASEASAQAIVHASARPVIDSHTTSLDRVPSSRGHSDKTLKMIAATGGVVGVHFADHMITQSAWRNKYTMLRADGLPRAGFRPRLWAYNEHVLALTDDPDERVRLRTDTSVQQEYYLDRHPPPDPLVAPVRAATLSQLADLVDYLVGVVGIDHVGLGGDVNGIDGHQWPEGLDHLGHLPRLTAELLSRGYRWEALEKLLSSNWHRVYSASLPA